VNYTYSYGDQRYSSESVYPGAEKDIGLKKDARAVADRFSPGETTTVYVNEKNPSRSYLVKEKTQFGPFMFMGIGGLIALVFLAAVGKELLRGANGG